MEVKDYYKILGIQRTASSDDIKKAYYRLIRRFHPDVCNNTPENLNKFLDITEAYRILGNLESRLQYSIQLNKHLLDEHLLHRHIKIPYFNGSRNGKQKSKVVIDI